MPTVVALTARSTSARRLEKVDPNRTGRILRSSNEDASSGADSTDRAPTTIRLAPASRQAPTTARAAPPAPATATTDPGSSNARSAVTDRTNPGASVLNPYNVPSALRWTELTAPIERAMGETSSQREATAVLWGAVT